VAWAIDPLSGRTGPDATIAGSDQNTGELRDAIERHEPKPFVWTKTADRIIAAVSRFCARTIARPILEQTAHSGH
jgi:hypothetical protein